MAARQTMPVTWTAPPAAADVFVEWRRPEYSEWRRARAWRQSRYSTLWVAQLGYALTAWIVWRVIRGR